MENGPVFIIIPKMNKMGYRVCRLSEPYLDTNYNDLNILLSGLCFF